MNKNRGMLLEAIINKTINYYRKNKIALFHKKELPIAFDKVIKGDRSPILRNAWIKSRSTTDYYGIYDGQFLAFEAKSTEQKSLSLKNIHAHQQKYLETIYDYGGISFYIILFKETNDFFLLSPIYMKDTERKSIDLEFMNKYGVKLNFSYPGIIDFIPVLKYIVQ